MLDFENFSLDKELKNIAKAKKRLKSLNSILSLNKGQNVKGKIQFYAKIHKNINFKINTSIVLLLCPSLLHNPHQSIEYIH